MSEAEPEDQQPDAPFKGVPVSVVVDELRAYEETLAAEAPRPKWSDAAPGEFPHRAALPFDPTDAKLTAILIDDGSVDDGSADLVEVPALPAGGPVFAGRPTPPPVEGRRAKRAANSAAPQLGTIVPAWSLPEADLLRKARRARRVRRVVTWLIVLAVLGGAYVAFRLAI